MRVADHVDAVRGEALGELGVERLRERVPGDQQGARARFFGGGLLPISTGSKASGVIGGMRPPCRARAPVLNWPPLSRFWLGLSGEVSLCETCWNGRLSAIELVGLPTAVITSWPIPGACSSPAWSTLPPEKTTRIAITSATARTDWRALKWRTPSRSKRLISLSSECCGIVSSRRP